MPLKVGLTLLLRILDVKDDLSLFAMIAVALRNRTNSMQQSKSACLLVLIRAMITLRFLQTTINKLTARSHLLIL